MNVILIEPHEILDRDRAILSGDRARHAREVLRARPGDTLRVGVIDGALGTAEVIAIDGDAVELRVSLAEAPPRPRVDLVLALPRPKVLGRLYSPIAQLGVGRVMLTNAERVERFYFDAHQLDPAYRRAHLVEGLAQARDTRVPEVTVHKSLRALLEDELDALAPETTRWLADPGPHPHPSSTSRSSERVVLAVGPEGGWNDFERELFARRGFVPISIGARPLRTDVALIALLAAVHGTL